MNQVVMMNKALIKVKVKADAGLILPAGISLTLVRVFGIDIPVEVTIKRHSGIAGGKPCKTTSAPIFAIQNDAP